MVMQKRDLGDRFFSGLVEHVFQIRLGVADSILTDYISDLLNRFVRLEKIYGICSLSGRPIREVTVMILEAEKREGDRKRAAHRHIGDFTLFWVGVYPDAVQVQQNEQCLGHLVDYSAEGKRSYWVASSIDTDNEAQPRSEVLEQLSQRFDLCAYGLREVRRQWEERDEDLPSVHIFT